MKRMEIGTFVRIGEWLDTALLVGLVVVAVLLAYAQLLPLVGVIL